MKISKKVQLHTALWVTHAILQYLLIFFKLDRPHLSNIIDLTAWYLLMIPSFYINSNFLCARYLVGRRYIAYFSGTAALFLMGGTYHFLLTRLYMHFDFHSTWAIASFKFIDNMIIAGLSLVSIVILSASFAFHGAWRKNERQKNQLITEKLQAELSYLRSQVNPDFLFYALDRIYEFSLERSDKAHLAILKLSEIIRYMLYESSQDKVDIGKEIRYLNNFVELQQLFTSNKYSYLFQVEEKALPGHIKVPPMLFATLFYPEPARIDSDVQVRLVTSEDHLSFAVSNKVSSSPSKEPDNMQHLKRRLDIIYPGAHELLLNYDDNFYKAELKLSLS